MAKLSDEWRELLSLIPGYDSEATADPTDWFDEDAAYFAIDFFSECLRFIEGSKGGQPFVLEPWQAAVTACLWGWKRADGTRRYRECLLYVPRKNGKSPWAAGMGLLYLSTETRDMGRQVVIGANDKAQSSIIFKHAAAMVAQEPMLSSRIRTYRTFKTLEHRDGSTLRALASDVRRLDGLNVSLALIDELHAHRDDALVNVLLTAQASRDQPLTIYTTTADFLSRPSICNTKYEYAVGVRDGTIKDRAFLPCIWEAPSNADWTSPDVWAIANPNLDVSVRRDFLERECARCLVEPSYQHVVKRLHLNIRTSSSTHWISAEHWNAAQRAFPELTGGRAYGGMDLSSTLDISSVVLAIPENDEPDSIVYLLPRFYVPEAKLDSRQDKVPYRQWHDAGLLTVTPGEVIDYEFIRRDVGELATRYALRSLRYDPWNATDLATRLSETDGLPMVPMRQGYASMSAPTREFERRVIAKQVAHDGNPILAWMLSGAMIVRDAHENRKLDKVRSAHRIDGIIASIMALAGCMANDNPASVYESRGIITIPAA